VMHRVGSVFLAAIIAACHRTGEPVPSATKLHASSVVGRITGLGWSRTRLDSLNVDSIPELLVIRDTTLSSRVDPHTFSSAWYAIDKHTRILDARGRNVAPHHLQHGAVVEVWPASMYFYSAPPRGSADSIRLLSAPGRAP